MASLDTAIRALGALSVALLAATVPCGAVTLDMESGVYSNLFRQYDERGYRFVTPADHFESTNEPPEASCSVQLCWHEGGANLVNNLVMLTRADGGAFNFLETDIGIPPWAELTPASITVESDLGHSLVFDPAVGHQVFNWMNVHWITFDLPGGPGAEGAAVFLDNTQVTAVPTPGAAFLLGIAALGLFASRRSARA